MPGQRPDWGCAASVLWCWGAWCQLWPQPCHALPRLLPFWGAVWPVFLLRYCGPNNFLYRYIIWIYWIYGKSILVLQQLNALFIFWKKHGLQKHLLIFLVALTISLQMDFLSSRKRSLQMMCSKTDFVDCIIFIN